MNEKEFWKETERMQKWFNIASEFIISKYKLKEINRPSQQGIIKESDKEVLIRIESHVADTERTNNLFIVFIDKRSMICTELVDTNLVCLYVDKNGNIIEKDDIVHMPIHGDFKCVMEEGKIFFRHIETPGFTSYPDFAYVRELGEKKDYKCKTNYINNKPIGGDYD